MYTVIIVTKSSIIWNNNELSYLWVIIKGFYGTWIELRVPMLRKHKDTYLGSKITASLFLENITLYYGREC